jgi:hypothetical protein
VWKVQGREPLIAAVLREKEPMRLLAILTVVAFLPAAACADSGVASPAKSATVSGYPVYKFLNLLGVDSDAFKANEKTLRAAMGDDYERYAKHHEAMISAGFDRHELLRVIGKDRSELDVYVRSEDYKKLWNVSPHALKEQGKSHFVTIEYEVITVGHEIVNRATSFKAELVDHKPILRK